MGLVRFVHHIQFACKNLWDVYDQLARGFGYQLFCVSNHGQYLNVVLKNGRTMFMLSEAGKPATIDLTNPYSYTVTNYFMDRERPFDIALEVSDVNAVCDRVKRLDGASGILLEPVTHTDYHGKVTMAVIKSCLGDVLHTIVDSSDYRGRFLPGYIAPEFGLSPTLKRRLNEMPVQSKNQSNKTDLASIDYLDHVALACNINESTRIIQWYNAVFDMKKIPANPLDDNSNGFVLKYGETGMRLKAVDYEKDAVNITEQDQSSCKFVIVEPLENSTPNQVTRFLTANGGPGIQHIGLGVRNIFGAVHACRAGGAQFLDPPSAYYDELLKTTALQRSGLDFDKFRSSGVLLDTEVLDPRRTVPPVDDAAYLLQIFTAPLFEKDGFFLELIQRHAGATGFGAANITALWRAAEAARFGPNPRSIKRSAN